MNLKKGSLVLDKHLLKLLNFSCIIKKCTHLFLTWDVDKEGTPCLFSRKGHTVLGVDAAQTAIKQMLKLSVLENLNVNSVFAGIIDFDVDDVYDVELIDRLLHILQRDKIRKAVLE